MIDTHCHLTFPDYEGRIESVLADARSAGVRGCITISTTTDDCYRALALAREYPGVWCSSGLHPLHAHEGPHVWSHLEDVARHDRCVAWGELGLDSHYSDPPKALQREVLDRQLELIVGLAGQIDKPIVVHCRDAFAELVPILESSGIAGERFVFHCFTGGPGDMELVLRMGAWASFTGVLTYRNAEDVRRAAAMLPIDRVMVETDAPFLTPAPHRGVRPNEPKYVVHTAEALAGVHGVDPGEFERVLDANAQRFFGIDLRTG